MRAPRTRRPGSAVHEGLTGTRRLVGTSYLADPTLRAEYARDIAPRTEAALERIWERLGALGLGDFGPGPVRALDLGAGTGAVGRALHARFGARLALTAVDRVPAPGLVRSDLASRLPPVDGPFDLIVAAHLLNELFVDRAPVERIELRAERVLAWAHRLLSPTGWLVIVDPALRETSRELLAVRDQVVAAGLRVLAPCFWTGPCPALARERDWCHDAAPAPRSRVDFSYLVLTPSVDRSAVWSREVFRLVGDPLHEKGRLRIYGCGPAGRHALVRLEREASMANSPLDEIRRGDVVRIEAARIASDGLRVTRDTRVTRIGP